MFSFIHTFFLRTSPTVNDGREGTIANMGNEENRERGRRKGFTHLQIVSVLPYVYSQQGNQI